MFVIQELKLLRKIFLILDHPELNKQNNNNNSYLVSYYFQTYFERERDR